MISMEDLIVEMDKINTRVGEADDKIRGALADLQECLNDMGVLLRPVIKGYYESEENS